MYKFLLCWRYLRTRWIALACIVSVTLGVATMIVVNSVMEGFSVEMHQRLHSVLSDIVFEAHTFDGFADAEWHMERIREIGGESIAGMTPTVAVPAMLSYQYGGNWVTRPVQLIGVDERTQAQAGDFAKYLQHPANREDMSFQLPEAGYDTRSNIGAPIGPERIALRDAGWKHRREAMRLKKLIEADHARHQTPTGPANPFDLPDVAQPPQAAEHVQKINPLAQGSTAAFDPEKHQRTGVVLGIALGTYRDRAGEDRFLLLPGDDVKLTFPTAGTPPRAIDETFTLVDYYECKMSEYDSTFVFVPMHKLQELRGMLDPQTGIRYVNSIQIKLRPGADLEVVRDQLRASFPPELYAISTWRDKQGPLLAAVQMETAILNVLLFMIIAVAGFGILAIFFMIVVEKTRDIGVLKSLGASGRGILGIFLTYGLSLGAVGAGAGLVLGLLFVWNINAIADLLGWITGQQVFDPSIYYFYKIPTLVDPWTVSWIVTGALLIAVLASILPARRAASLHPVEALRYE